MDAATGQTNGGGALLQRLSALCDAELAQSRGTRVDVGGLSARSAAYSLSVLGALYRWLIQQRYVLANPFAGLKVRGAGKSGGLSVTRAFSDGEWATIRAVAEGLEWSYGWEPAAAQRLRFVLDFAYTTGLRASELVDARLGMIKQDARGERWLCTVGKGSKAGSMALSPLARAALDRYLAPAAGKSGAGCGRRHQRRAAVGGDEAVLRADGRRNSGRKSRGGREVAAGQPALETAFASRTR